MSDQNKPASSRAANGTDLASISSRLTAARLLHQRAAAVPDDVAIRQGVSGGRWADWTWHRLAEATAQFGSGLLALGARKGDHVGILCGPRIEAIIAFLGAQAIGCVPFAIHGSAPAATCSQILSDAQPAVVVTDNGDLLREALRMATARPLCLCDLVPDGHRATSDPLEPSIAAVGWNALLQAGARRQLDDPAEYSCAVEQTRPDDVAVIYYTSGTTGASKGVLLTWQGLVLSLCGIFGGGDLADLPSRRDRTMHETSMATPAGAWFGILYPLVYGCIALIPPSHDYDAEAVRQMVQPTIYYGRPAVWTATASAIELAMGQASGLQRLGYRLLMRVGGYRLDRHGQQKSVPAVADAVHRVLIAAFIRRALHFTGFGSLRYAFSGGAPLSSAVVRQWYCWGVNIRTFYGMTECSGVATMVKDAIPRPETVGTPLPFADVRLSEEGEILIGGPIIFKGYLNRPSQTAEALDRDGFFHTGDLGEMLEDGSLVMLDRKSNVIQLCSGEKIISSQLESSLRLNPCIKFCMIVGQNRPYPCALIEINPEQVRQKLSTSGAQCALNYAELAAHPAVAALVATEIEMLNAKLAAESKPVIRHFRLLPQTLDIRDPQLATATGKIRRANLIERYGELVAEMYPAIA